MGNTYFESIRQGIIKQQEKVLMPLDIVLVRKPLLDHVMLLLPNIRKEESALEKVQKAVSSMPRDTKSWR